MRSSPAGPDRDAARDAPSVTVALRFARLATGLAMVALPLVHAGTLEAGGATPWPVVAGVFMGLACRALAGTVPAVALALALAPVWQVLVTRFQTPGNFDHIMPWLAFLGAALAWPGARPWQAEGAWAGATAAWALVLALVTPIVVARELDFTWLATQWPHLANVVLIGAVSSLVALLLFDWYSGARDAERRLAWRALVPGTVAAALVALWQQHVDPAFLSHALWAGLRRSAGTLYDANATGALLALTTPVLASAWVRPRAVPRLWSGLCLSLGLAGIIATGSRSALVAFALVIATQVVVAGRAWRWAAAGAALALGGWLVLAGAPVADAASGDALGRLADTIRQVLSRGSEGLWAVLWDRDGYGPTAVAMIADHPWAGAGPGLFGSLVPGYSLEAIGRVLPPDNAQNWWRHQVAELGVPGALPSFVCAALALRALIQRRSGPAVAPLAGLGLLAFVSPPMAHPIVQVLVGLIVAHAVTAAPPAAGREPHRGHGLAVWVLAPGCAAALLVAGARDLRPAYRATRFHTLYSYGVTAMQSTPWGNGRWMGTHAVAVFGQGGSRLVTRIVIPHEDAQTRPVHVTVANRDGVACRHDAVDATPFECRMAVAGPDWPMVEVTVSRPWRDQDGMARAAVVEARYED